MMIKYLTDIVTVLYVVVSNFHSHTNYMKNEITCSAPFSIV